MSKKDYERRKSAIKKALENGEIDGDEYEQQREDLKTTYETHKQVLAGQKERDKAAKEAALTPEERLRSRVEKRIKDRREEFFGLVMHLFWYIVITTWLFDLDGWISNILNGQGLVPVGGQWIALFWGIGVVSQLLSYYGNHGPGARRREQEIQREYEREYARLYGSHPPESRLQSRKLKNEDIFYDDAPQVGIRLTEDGEFTDSYIAELYDDDDAQENLNAR